MSALRKKIVVCLDPAILVSGSFDLFRYNLSVGDLSDIDRIGQDCFDQRFCKMGEISLTQLALLVAVLVQIPADCLNPHSLVGVQVKDNSDNLRVLGLNRQGIIFFIEFIAERSRTSVPFSFTGFLLSPLHGLHQDVFTLYFRHCREDCDRQLTGISGGINSVLHTDQVYTVVLDILQGVKDICRITPETGKFKYQNVLHSVAVIGNVL